MIPHLCQSAIVRSTLMLARPVQHPHSLVYTYSPPAILFAVFCLHQLAACLFSRIHSIDAMLLACYSVSARWRLRHLSPPWASTLFMVQYTYRVYCSAGKLKPACRPLAYSPSTGCPVLCLTRPLLKPYNNKPLNPSSPNTQSSRPA